METRAYELGVVKLLAQSLGHRDTQDFRVKGMSVAWAFGIRFHVRFKGREVMKVSRVSRFAFASFVYRA